MTRDKPETVEGKGWKAFARTDRMNPAPTKQAEIKYRGRPVLHDVWAQGEVLVFMGNIRAAETILGDDREWAINY